MKRAVWKFDVSNSVTLDMPIGAKILSVQAQGAEICMWALVNTDAKTEKRNFVVYGTGYEIPGGRMSYVGTAQIAGGLVFHVFELLKTLVQPSYRSIGQSGRVKVIG